MKAQLALTPILILAGSLSAQSQGYGFKDFAFPNQSGQGASRLDTRVYYPSTSTGANAPIKLRVGGYPVIVMLHGFSVIGNDYSLIGRYFADKGYVVALPNTSRLLGPTQTQEALALLPALKVANSSGFLKGALNEDKIGLAGHSMGGNSTFAVLANNPGYQCGLAIAPINASTVINKVRVPIGVIHGKGDWVLNWRLNGLPTYNAANNYTTLKFLYLMSYQCGHNNIAGILLITQRDRSAWERAARVMQGFFDKFLSDKPEGLEEVAGLSARSASVLDTLYIRCETPSAWIAGTPEIGKTAIPTLLAETGTAILAAALTTTRISLPIGLLQLDPATLITLQQGSIGSNRLLSTQLNVPNDPSLRGRIFPVQGLGQNNSQTLRLSNLAPLAIR